LGSTIAFTVPLLKVWVLVARVTPLLVANLKAECRSQRSAKKYLVIGAGPAGMELAGLAAERGHDVTLWEKAGGLGGQVALSSKVRMNANYGKWITFQEWRLAEAGVKIEMNKSADVDAVLAFGADTVAIATGAKVRRPGIPGDTLPHVLTVADVIEGNQKPGKHVLVIAEDDRPSPLTVAEHIAMQSEEV